MEFIGYTWNAYTINICWLNAGYFECLYTYTAHTAYIFGRYSVFLRTLKMFIGYLWHIFRL